MGESGGVEGCCLPSPVLNDDTAHYIKFPIITSRRPWAELCTCPTTSCLSLILMENNSKRVSWISPRSWMDYIQGMWTCFLCHWQFPKYLLLQFASFPRQEEDSTESNGPSASILRVHLNTSDSDRMSHPKLCRFRYQSPSFCSVLAKVNARFCSIPEKWVSPIKCWILVSVCS